MFLYIYMHARIIETSDTNVNIKEPDGNTSNGQLNCVQTVVSLTISSTVVSADVLIASIEANRVTISLPVTVH
jgi:hypothetical protein